MRKISIGFIIIVLTLSTIPFFVPGNVIASTAHAPIRIDSNADFAIGINGVSAGDGSAENPWIIEGWDINGTGLGDCIYIGNTTDFFEVRNCYLHEASEREEGVYYRNTGLFLHHVNNGTIANNIINQNVYGILLESSTINTLSNNTVVLNSWNGITLFSFSDNNTITNNIVNSNKWRGIVIETSNGNILANNNVLNNTDGIKIYTSSHDTYIANNNVTNNDNGIYIWFSCSNISVVNNTVSDNNYGIQIHNDCHENTICGNNIRNNNVGIYIYTESSDNTIYHNNFTNNTDQALDRAGNNRWDNGYPGGGNYWSDYDGESNYHISGELSVDNFPLTEPYGNQPEDFDDGDETPGFGFELIFLATIIGVFIYNRKKRS